MKLWRINWSDPDHGYMQHWSGTKAEAMKSMTAKSAEYEGDRPTFTLQSENVPTEKAALVAWLNRRFDTDNG